MRFRDTPRLEIAANGETRVEKREENKIPNQLSEVQTSEKESKSGASGAAIAMYCVLLLAYSLMAADRYLFPFLNSDVRKEFGFSVPTIGLLSTIFTLGLGIGGLPTGYLLSRFSRKSVLILGIAIFSGATMLTTVATGFWTMLFCLAVTGIGMAMLATSMFALAASYFIKYRAAAIGSVNFCYGLGGFYAPILASAFLVSYKTWHAPMLAFAGFGFGTIVLILLFVRSWFSETRRTAQARADAGGAPTLMNRNSILLTALSMIHGLSMYGFLGLYTLYLREEPPLFAGRSWESDRLFWNRSAGLGILRLVGRSPVAASRAEWSVSVQRGARLLVFSRSGICAVARIYDVRLRRRGQRHSVRQSRRLSRKSGTRQFGEPRIGNVCHQPLLRGRVCRLFDGLDRSQPWLGDGRNNSNVRAFHCGGSPFVGLATQ